MNFELVLVPASGLLTEGNKLDGWIHQAVTAFMGKSPQWCLWLDSVFVLKYGRDQTDLCYQQVSGSIKKTSQKKGAQKLGGLQDQSLKMLQTGNYSLVLLIQLTLLAYDLFVNSFSELLRGAPVIQLVLFMWVSRTTCGLDIQLIDSLLFLPNWYIFNKRTYWLQFLKRNL